MQKFGQPKQVVQGELKAFSNALGEKLEINKDLKSGGIVKYNGRPAIITTAPQVPC